MSKFRGLAALFVLPLLIAGCGFDRDKGILMAAGSYGDLAVVVSDENLRPAVERFLNKFNREYTFVIAREKVFAIDVFSPRQFDLCRNYKNILIVARIGDGGPVQKQVERLVSASTLQQMAGGGGALVQLDDPFATYQFGMVAATADRNSLISMLNNSAEKIRDIFQQKSRERIQRHNRHVGLQNGLMATLWDRFGFFIEIPEEFRQNQVEPDRFPGLELMATGPSRGISVSWMPHENPREALADRALLLEMREALGELMHNEELVPETFVWNEATIDGNPSVKLEGAWNSNVFAGGGPFWCYFIPDMQSKRLLCLDLLVYAPHEDKMGFFRNLDAVAATFSLQQPHP